MFLKTDLDARKRGLCELHHRLQLVTQGTRNPAMITGDVVAFQKRSTVCSAWEGKCRNNALAKGAAGQHAFLRKADEPHQTHVTFNDKKERWFRAQRCP